MHARVWTHTHTHTHTCVCLWPEMIYEAIETKTSSYLQVVIVHGTGVRAWNSGCGLDTLGTDSSIQVMCGSGVVLSPYIKNHTIVETFRFFMGELRV